MGKFDGYLLVTDFDDTFRPYGQREVPAANREAAEYFMAEGGLFTIATGRAPRSFLAIEQYFNINAPAILCNGLVLFDAAAREDVFEGFLPFSCRNDFKEILEEFPEYGLEIHRGAEVLVARSSSGVEQHLGEVGIEIVTADIDKIMFPWTFACFCSPMPIAEENQRTRDLAEALTGRYGGKYLAVPSGGIIDVTAAGYDKGSGVQRLAELLGIPRERIIGVGDNNNDLPLLRQSAFAFAPEGALDCVKAEPGVITVGPCETCLRDAVEYLEKEIK